MDVYKEESHIQFDTIYDKIYGWVNQNEPQRIINFLRCIYDGNFNNETLKSVLVISKPFKKDLKISEYRDKIKQKLENNLGYQLV
jgi:hypothetical protein